MYEFKSQLQNTIAIEYENVSIKLHREKPYCVIAEQKGMHGTSDTGKCIRQNNNKAENLARGHCKRNTYTI